MLDKDREIHQSGIPLKVFGFAFFQYVAMGLFFSVIGIGLSLFESGQKAAYLRLFSAYLPAVFVLAGIVKVGTMLVEYYIKRRKQ